MTNGFSESGQLFLFFLEKIQLAVITYCRVLPKLKYKLAAAIVCNG